MRNYNIKKVRLYKVHKLIYLVILRKALSSAILGVGTQETCTGCSMNKTEVAKGLNDLYHYLIEKKSIVVFVR